MKIFSRSRSRSILNFVVPGLLAISINSCQQPSKPRPNILFIFADDLGWGDLECHGHPEIKTPNIDKLASEGVDFHHFTVNGPVCSPSRAAILTGHFPARYCIHGHFATGDKNRGRGMPDWLDPDAVLLTRLLQEEGYTTGHFGKWHLSGPDPDSPPPTDYGIDESAVYVGTGRGIFDGTSLSEKDSPLKEHDSITASFLTAAAVEHTIRFIRNAGETPFFVNLWIHETHHLVSATDDDRKAYPDTPEPFRTYYSAVTRADRLIGNVMATLKELGKDSNTIIIFASDNGPEFSHPKPTQKFYRSVGSTGGLRGRKRSLYMGGVNTPFIVRWKGHFPEGVVDSTAVVSGVDILPTLMDIVGKPLPENYEPDGVNILPALWGHSFRREKPLYWQWITGNDSRESYWPRHGMREGEWGLLRNEKTGRVELYNLLEDRFQENNLAGEKPDLVTEMTRQLRKWRGSLPEVCESKEDNPSY